MTALAGSRLRLDAVTFDEPLDLRLASLAPDGVWLHWLGQAGFVVSAGGRRLLIDPYLSDTLADKYRGSATPHERLMPAPVSVDGLGAIDLVLVTHHHTDHMDPGTLGPLAAAQPALRFVVPAASLDEAARRTGVAPARLLPLDAGASLRPWPGVPVSASQSFTAAAASSAPCASSWRAGPSPSSTRATPCRSPARSRRPRRSDPT